MLTSPLPSSLFLCANCQTCYSLYLSKIVLAWELECWCGVCCVRICFYSDFVVWFQLTQCVGGQWRKVATAALLWLKWVQGSRDMIWLSWEITIILVNQKLPIRKPLVYGNRIWGSLIQNLKYCQYLTMIYLFSYDGIFCDWCKPRISLYHR